MKMFVEITYKFEVEFASEQVSKDDMRLAMEDVILSHSDGRSSFSAELAHYGARKVVDYAAVVACGYVASRLFPSNSESHIKKRNAFEGTKYSVYSSEFATTSSVSGEPIHMLSCATTRGFECDCGR